MRVVGIHEGCSGGESEPTKGTKRGRLLLPPVNGDGYGGLVCQSVGKRRGATSFPLVLLSTTTIRQREKLRGSRLLLLGRLDDNNTARMRVDIAQRG